MNVQKAQRVLVASISIFVVLIALISSYEFGRTAGMQEISLKWASASVVTESALSRCSAAGQESSALAQRSLRVAETWRLLAEQNQRTADRANATGQELLRTTARWERVANGFKEVATDCEQKLNRSGRPIQWLIAAPPAPPKPPV